MEALISVIIPIYNMEAYLARCLDSVLNNTYRNLEVLCVDDGSKDATPDILRTYAEKDPRIIVITKENGGVSSARNAGLDCMTGEYVCFVDPDDYVHPQYVELLYRAVQETGTGIAICGFLRTQEADPPVSYEAFSFEPSTMQVFSFFQVFKKHDYRAYVWGKLFRAEVLTNTRFHEDMHYSEDTLFFSEVCESISPARRVSVLLCPLYYYLLRENSLAKTVTSSENMLFVRRLSQKLFQPNSRDDIYLDHIINRCLLFRYLYKYINAEKDYARECNEILTRVRKRIWKTKLYKGTQKARFLVAIQFPSFYRFRLISADPSMYGAEKAAKEKRRVEKRKLSHKNSGKR